MKEPSARIGGEPGGQIGAGRVPLTAFVTNMRERVRPMRVVRVRRDGPLDLRPGSRELPIFGQRHGMVRQEPEIVTVMRREAIQQRRDLVLLSDAAGGADQAVRVRGSGQHHRVARPCRQVRVQGGDRRVGLAREHQFEERNVAGVALGQIGSHLSGRRQRHPRRRHAAFPQQDLRLASMGEGKTRVGGDGAIEGLDRAGVEGQRQIAALDIGVPRRDGHCG